MTVCFVFRTSFALAAQIFAAFRDAGNPGGSVTYGHSKHTRDMKAPEYPIPSILVWVSKRKESFYQRWFRIGA